MTQVEATFVHIQVMFQIADHFTNAKFLKPSFKGYHIGLLLGEFKDGCARISNSTEMYTLNKPDGSFALPEYYNTFVKYNKSIFEKETPIGWYAFSSDPHGKGEINPDIVDEIHQIFTNYDQKSTFLFRCEYHFGKAEPFDFFLTTDNHSWVPVSVTYKTETAERIALTQLESQGTSEDQITFSIDAYKNLSRRLGVIEQYLRDVKSGKAQFYPEIVRKAASIGQWWSTPKKNQNDDYIDQANLSLLCGMLSETTTKIFANTFK